MPGITEQAVALFREAEPMAQRYMMADGPESLSHEDQLRLAGLLDALNRELGIKAGGVSPLFINEKIDLNMQMHVQKLRIELLKELQRATH